MCSSRRDRSENNSIKIGRLMVVVGVPAVWNLVTMLHKHPSFDVKKLLNDFSLENENMASWKILLMFKKFGHGKVLFLHAKVFISQLQIEISLCNLLGRWTETYFSHMLFNLHINQHNYRDTTSKMIVQNFNLR